MEKIELKDAFAEFKNQKNIDRPTMMGVLEDVFRTQITKTYGSADNFDIIINIDKGDCEIYWNREVVEEVEDPNTQIALEDLDDDDYEIGETFAKTIELKDIVGRFFYNTTISDRRYSAIDIAGMEDLFAYLNKSDLYTIAKIPALRDYYHGLENVSHGLAIKGGYLWMEPGTNCYWLNPTKDGTGVRDYIHVVDLAVGHLKAIEKLEANPKLGLKIYNLGTGNGLSVFEIIKAAEAVTGKKIPFEIAPRRAGDPPRLIACSDRAKEMLNWQPKHESALEIIESAWKWQQKFPDGYAK